jgi:hypothetical protein
MPVGLARDVGVSSSIKEIVWRRRWLMSTCAIGLEEGTPTGVRVAERTLMEPCVEIPVRVRDVIRFSCHWFSSKEWEMLSCTSGLKVKEQTRCRSREVKEPLGGKTTSCSARFNEPLCVESSKS